MKKRAMILIGSSLIFINFIFFSITYFNDSKNIIGDIFNLNRSFSLLFLVVIMLIGFILIGGLEKITENESEQIDSKSINSGESNYQDYIARHTPEYLNGYEQSMLYKGLKWLGKLTLKEVKGQDNLPKGPKLFIVNHRVPWGEYLKLIASTSETVHPFVARNFGYDYFQWLVRGIGAIPINASLMNLNDKQKKEVLGKVPFFSNYFFKEAFRKQDNGYRGASNSHGVRSMASVLMQGRNGAIFSEGPAYMVNSGLNRAYAGYALVAREYEKQTGKKLPIVPVGVNKGKVSFGKPIYIDEKRRLTKKELEDIATEKIKDQYDSL